MSKRISPVIRPCLLLALAFTPPLPAEPEGGGELAQQFDAAEWISHVRIESVASLINPAMSQNELLAVQGYRYSASVVEAWKGAQSGTIRFEVELSDCSRLLQVDREYIVFGSTNYRGGLESTRCEDLISVDGAGSLPKVLDEYSRSRRVAGESKAAPKS